MPDIRHKRGTRAALDALAGSNGLKPGQIYVLTDEARIAVALTASTYQAFSKEGEGGGAGYYEGPTAPDPVDFPLWFNTTAGAFLVYVGATWIEPGANFIPAGGAAGQVLIKQSVTDFAMAWGAPTVVWGDVSGKPATFAPSAHAHEIADVTGLQSALDAKLSSETDPVFLASPAAGISAPLIANWSTAFGWGNHASAGYLLPAAIGVTVQGYNANTVFDAAYVHTDNNYDAAAASKLAGIAAGATVNSPDATLLARANHTGTQAATTIADGTVSDAEFQYLNGVTSSIQSQLDAKLDETLATAITATKASPVDADELIILDSADSATPKKTTRAQLLSGVGGATNLSYTAATRVIASDTGADATLPLVSTSDAGLAPASGGGTTNFLRADGTWAAPAGVGGGASPILSWAI